MRRVVAVGVLLALSVAGAPLARAAATVSTWTGLGADNNWQTAANWDVAAASGNDLVFPIGAPRQANVNNFPDGTEFASILIDGTSGNAGSYAITGNRVKISGAINHFGPFPLGDSSHTFGPAVTLTAAQTWNANNNGLAIAMHGVQTA